MQRFLLLLAVSACLYACNLRRQSFSEEELIELTDRKMLGEDGTLRRSLSDVWVNTSAFCQSDQAVDCVVELDRLQHELNDLNPVPVPQPDSALPVSPEKATSLYKAFVSAHQGEPIEAVFRQLYPRILLNKYAIKTSNDYPLIAYFATELTQSDALDFDLRTELLPILAGHIPNDEYTKLVNSTVESAKREMKRHKRELARLQALIALNPKEFSPFDQSTYLTASHRRLVKKYQQSTLATNVAKLDQYQRLTANL